MSQTAPREEAGFISPMGQEVAEQICGAKGDRIIAACHLAPCHVQTMDDWHETSAAITETVKTNTYETSITRLETTRWAPNPFELKDKDAGKRILERCNRDKEED